MSYSLTNRVQWFPDLLIGTNIFEMLAKFSPDHNKRVLEPLLTISANVVSATSTSAWRRLICFHITASTTFNCRKIRVRFFGKIQNWIIDLRSHGYFAPKETKNPKMDFCHDNGVNTFCTGHKNFRTNLLSVECILAKFISAYKIFHKNHTTKLFFFSLEHNVARNASESEECLQNDQCQLHS